MKSSRRLPLALLFTWVTVEGGYWLYWSRRNPETLALMRDANFLASLCLYAICGLGWHCPGRLRELGAEAGSSFGAPVEYDDPDR